MAKTCISWNISLITYDLYLYPPITGTQNTGLFLNGDRPQYIIGIYIPFVGIPIMVDDQYPSHVLTAHLTWECEKLGRHGLSFETLDIKTVNRCGPQKMMI
jgi:hypothetical protein